MFHTPIKARAPIFSQEDFAELHRQTRIYEQRIASITRAPSSKRRDLTNQLRAEVVGYAAGGAGLAPVTRDRDGRFGA